MSERTENVFAGEPDARQAGDIQVSRFRPRYRALTPEEKAVHDELKADFEAIEAKIMSMNAGRYRALAITSLEEACMWAIKELTS